MAIFGCRVWSLSICGVGFGVLEVFGRVVSYTMEGRKETRDTVRGRGWDLGRDRAGFDERDGV